MAAFTAFDAPGVSAQPQASAVSLDAAAATGKGVAQVGDAIVKVGQQLQLAQQRTDNRNDTVHRARAFNEFSNLVAQEELRIQTEEDAANPETTKSFGLFLKDNFDRILQEHRQVATSEDSLARLSVRLGSLQTESSQRVGLAVTKAGRDMVRTGLGENMGRIALETRKNNDIFGGFEKVDAEVEEAKGSLTSNEEAGFRISGRAAVLTSVFEERLSVGDLEGARAVLEVPDADKILGAPDFRKKLGAILKIERAEEKGRIAGEQRLEEVAAILGVDKKDLTDVQRLRIAKLGPKDGKQTLSEWLTELKEVLGPGHKITADMINKKAGAFIEDPAPMGKGRIGLAEARLTDDAIAFAQGALNIQDENRYRTAAHAYTQGIRHVNKETGEVEIFRAELPPAAVEAFRARGLPVPGLDTKPAVGEDGRAADGPQLTPEADLPDSTIFQDAHNATGPIAVGATILGRIPLVGDFFRPDAQERTQTRIRLLTRELVRVMQNSPKFNEGERVSIENDLNLGAKVFDTVGAFRNRVIAIDDALDVRQKAAQSILDAPAGTTGLDERVQARRMVNALERFRINLGAPPLMKSAEEARKLPENALFRMKGSVKLKRNRKRKPAADATSPPPPDTSGGG